jgi:AmmeMemoRadiSam system protein A
LLEPRATFVTLTVARSGELRGCRGEIAARHPLAESVIRMAIASATDDPRFPPVTAGEVPHLHIEISVLTPLEPIAPEAVEVGRHGLYLSLGGRAGLLLPQVPGDYGWSRKQFLAHTCRKAGLPDDAWRHPAAKLYGFECEVFGEEESRLDDRPREPTTT